MHGNKKERRNNMPQYNTDKLREAISEKFGTIAAFSKAADLEPSTVSRLLQRGNWKASQMKAALNALNIPLSEVGAYFFEEKSAIAQQHGGKI